MKKYSIDELGEAHDYLLDLSENPVISDFFNKVKVELKKRENPFVKATDDYIKSLKDEEVERRLMKKSDDYFVNGFYGLFEKGSGKLLRRHSDTGLLPSPYSLNNPR